MTETPRSTEVVVIGAGIVGLACADALVRRGVRCRIVDAGAVARPGWRAASWASAGMIAPLAEVPECDNASRDFLDVCLRSRDLWSTWAPELHDATGVDLDYDRSGALLVDDVADAAEPSRLDRFEARARQIGEPTQRLTPAEVRRLVPNASPDLDFGLRLGGEHRVDNRRVCEALLRRLETAGVEIECGVTVRKVERQSGGVEVGGVDARGRVWRASAGAALVAAGAWSGGIAGLPSLPIRPLCGQMLRVAGVDWPFLGCVRGAHFYAVRRRGPGGGAADGELLIGATEDEAGFDAHVTAAGLGQLTGWLRRVFPGLAEHPITDTWAGLRPTPPDGRPLLGPIDDGVWLASGHHRNGILLTPWTADVMARWIVDGEPPAGAGLFSPQRFEDAAVVPEPA